MILGIVLPIFGPNLKLIPKNPILSRCREELTLRTIPPEPEKITIYER
jgi:hypothetical protein